jgi:hypothetical protein
MVVVAKATGSWNVQDGQSPSVDMTLSWSGDSTLAQNSCDAVYYQYISGKTVRVDLISNGTLVMSIGTDPNKDTVSINKGSTTIEITAKSTKQFQQATTITEIDLVAE